MLLTAVPQAQTLGDDPGKIDFTKRPLCPLKSLSRPLGTVTPSRPPLGIFLCRVPLALWLFFQAFRCYSYPKQLYVKVQFTMISGRSITLLRVEDHELW